MILGCYYVTQALETPKYIKTFSSKHDLENAYDA
jgi:hypothetical protein